MGDIGQGTGSQRTLLASLGCGGIPVSMVSAPGGAQRLCTPSTPRLPSAIR